MKQFKDMVPVDPREGSNIECYRYLGSHWMESLQNAELKLADVNEFNDIFDGRGGCVNELRHEAIIEILASQISDNFNFNKEKALANLKKKLQIPKQVIDAATEVVRQSIHDRQMAGDLKVICFAKPENRNSDALMWSHYANHWKGVRLGFSLLYDIHKEIDFKELTTPYILEPIKYSAIRPTLDLSLLTSLVNDPIYIDFFRKAIITKSIEWRYEAEWRLLVDRVRAVQRFVNNKLMFFWKFHPLLLKTIDLGPEIDKEHESELVNFVKLYYPHVTVNRVVLDQVQYRHDYKLIYGRNSVAGAESDSIFNKKVT